MALFEQTPKIFTPLFFMDNFHLFLFFILKFILLEPTFLMDIPIFVLIIQIFRYWFEIIVVFHQPLWRKFISIVQNLALTLQYSGRLKRSHFNEWLTLLHFCLSYNAEIFSLIKSYSIKNWSFVVFCLFNSPLLT